jgi:CheY-like chemotaxis protein
MSWVLAVQPDSAQADILREALRAHISEEIVVARSLDEALALIDRRVPDLILLPILMPAAVEDHLLAYLGTNPGARHAQILGLPYLERPAPVVPQRRRWFFPWRSRQQPTVVSTPVWDPNVFTRDVIAYLATSRAIKEEIELYGKYGTGGGAERRLEPRFATDEVPWISYVSFDGERAALINVSARGALLRTHSRPGHQLLKRSVPDARHWSPLTLRLETNDEVHATGRVVRCVPLRSEAGPRYEIAFSFDRSVGLHLPSVALIPAFAGADDD